MKVKCVKDFGFFKEDNIYSAFRLDCSCWTVFFNDKDETVGGARNVLDMDFSDFFLPINKVEPKFKIGDTVTVKPMSCHGKVFKGKPFKIVDIIKDNYVCDDGKTCSISLQDGWELVEQKPVELGENRSKELSLSLQIQAYLNTASDELYAKGKPLYSEERLEDIHKCMLMWQKLHNAYFYHNPVEWSKEDEKIISDAEVWLDTLCDYLKYSSSAYIPNVRVIISKLKSLKDRVQPKPKWSEDDEKVLHAIRNALNYEKPRNYLKSRDFEFTDILDWLKSLKDRVQPKQELREEDESMIKRIKEYLNIAIGDLSNKLNGRIATIGNSEYSSMMFEISECISWLEVRLKSLRPQSQWKPSDEQLEALNTINVTGCITEVGQGKSLVELYKQLMKLREE